MNKIDLEGAFQAAAKGRASALITIRDTLINRYRRRIADRAIKNRQPSMYEGSEYVEDGGLMSYAISDAESYHRAPLVDKILKGTKPADLPVEQPAKFELVINLKTAKQIGLMIPANLLARANKVIGKTLNASVEKHGFCFSRDQEMSGSCFEILPRRKNYLLYQLLRKLEVLRKFEAKIRYFPILVTEN